MAGRHVTDPGGEGILLDLDDVPPCTRCVSEALLRARFSHSWRNASGKIVSGIRAAELYLVSPSPAEPASHTRCRPRGRVSGAGSEDRAVTGR
ncbi:DUF6300 family protein [Streptomyces sp. NPDC004685]